MKKVLFIVWTSSFLVINKTLSSMKVHDFERQSMMFFSSIGVIRLMEMVTAGGVAVTSKGSELLRYVINVHES